MSRVKGSVAYAKALVGKTKKDTGPERRWLEGEDSGGGWEIWVGQSTWDLEGHLEEVRTLPKTCEDVTEEIIGSIPLFCVFQNIHLTFHISEVEESSCSTLAFYNPSFV